MWSQLLFFTIYQHGSAAASFLFSRQLPITVSSKLRATVLFISQNLLQSVCLLPSYFSLDWQKKMHLLWVLEIKVGKNIMLLSLWLQWGDKKPAEPRKVLERLESPLNINIHITPTCTAFSLLLFSYLYRHKSIRFYYLVPWGISDAYTLMYICSA